MNDLLAIGCSFLAGLIASVAMIEANNRDRR